MSAVDDLPWPDKRDPIEEVCFVCDGCGTMPSVDAYSLASELVKCPMCNGTGIIVRGPDGE